MAGGLLALNAHGLFELDVHGHSDEARGVARRLLAHVGPMMDDSLTADALVDMRAGLLAFLGEWGELARVVDETAPSHRSSLALSLRGVASAMLGDTADARRRAEAITPGKSLTGPVERARILASLGDMQGALTLLRTTDAPGYSWQYHGDVIYRLMRNYPPFEQYLKQRD
jgi:hypothetical protein